MSKKTREIKARYEATRAEVREMEREAARDAEAAAKSAALADRLTRDALRPQVGFNC